MGGAASIANLPETINHDLFKQIAGDLYSVELFDQLKNWDGVIPREDLIRELAGQEAGLVANTGAEIHRDTLVAMGFSLSLVNRAIDDANKSLSGGESVEDLIIRATTLQSAESNKSRRNSKADFISGAKPMMVDPNQLGGGGVVDQDAFNLTGGKLLHLRKFINDAPLLHSGDVDPLRSEDASELYCKFTMARSVLETFSDGSSAAGTSSQVLTLLDWASDMLALYEDIVSAYEQKIPFPTAPTQHEDKLSLYVWYRELEVVRRKADEEHVAGNMLSDTEMKRRGELDSIAASVGYMYSLFSMYILL